MEDRERLEQPMLVRAVEEEGERERERVREAQARLGKLQAGRKKQELVREGEAQLALSEAHRDLLLHEVTNLVLSYQTKSLPTNNSMYMYTYHHGLSISL